jgi:threonine synthase
MKLSELVEIKQEQCPKCISYTYTLAHKIDVELCKKLRIFGKELYPISIVNVFKVEEPDRFYVECMLGTKYLKIWFAKTMGVEIERRVSVLEGCLIDWFSDVFDSQIEEG